MNHLHSFGRSAENPSWDLLDVQHLDNIRMFFRSEIGKNQLPTESRTFKAPKTKLQGPSSSEEPCLSPYTNGSDRFKVIDTKFTRFTNLHLNFQLNE